MAGTTVRRLPGARRAQSVGRTPALLVCGSIQQNGAHHWITHSTCSIILLPYTFHCYTFHCGCCRAQSPKALHLTKIVGSEFRANKHVVDTQMLHALKQKCVRASTQSSVAMI